MASNEVNVENSNVSGSEDPPTDTNITLNSLVLLVRIKHVEGRPMEPEMLTEAALRNSVHILTQHIDHTELKFLVLMNSV